MCLHRSCHCYFGVLYLKCLEPGPIIFVKTPELVYAIFLAFLIANLLLSPFGWIVIRAARHLLRVPAYCLPPQVLACCIVESFAINSTPFGVATMLVFGVVGWIFEENGIPVAPAILGIVLGGAFEFNFVTSLIKSDGSLMIFVEGPIAACLAFSVLLVWALPVYRIFKRRT